MKHFYDECPYNITLNCNTHKYHFIIMFPTLEFHTKTRIEFLLPSKFTNITYTPINYHIKTRGKFPNICLSMWFIAKDTDVEITFYTSNITYLNSHRVCLSWWNRYYSVADCIMVSIVYITQARKFFDFNSFLSFLF